MNSRGVLVALALIAGALSGSGMLESASLAEPPLHWPDLGLIFVGSAFSLPLVLGLQALAGNNKALRWGWSFFALAAVFLVAGGVSAVAVSVFRNQVAPSSFMFLVVGIGLSIGAALVKMAFSRRFEHVV